MGDQVNPTIARLAEAMNNHDAQGMAALMAPDYHSVQPVHPHREFRGNHQVALNWTTMFAGVPNMVGTVVAEDTIGSRSWSEWRWDGHHVDGSRFAMRGVIIAGLRFDGLVQWMRLYVEPVEEHSEAIKQAVQGLSGAPE